MSHLRLVRAEAIDKTESFVATGVSVAPTELPWSLGTFALQIVEVGGTLTAWDVRLEGSLDGVSWSTIRTHVTGDGAGATVFTGANRYSPRYVRVNVSGLTLGTATSISVLWRAAA